MHQKAYSHGKLLITGEYAILDGAWGLALPTKLGQSLSLHPIEGKSWQWNSYLHNKQLWQQIEFDTKAILEFDQSLNELDFKGRILQLLHAIFQLKSPLLSTNQAFQVKTQLEFPKDWGLGSSSTLVANLAECFQVNAYELLELSFGGSGYDLACAKAKQALIYQRQGFTPKISYTALSPKLTSHVYFVYRNQKQNSREAIQYYRQTPKPNLNTAIKQLNLITKDLTSTDDLNHGEDLLLKHEAIIGKLINQTPVQQKLFSDYSSGIVKSLGAWGGDFMLVTAKQPQDLDYFRDKGYSIIKTYSSFVL
jgi:mevalonate kinase